MRASYVPFTMNIVWGTNMAFYFREDPWISPADDNRYCCDECDYLDSLESCEEEAEEELIEA